MMLILWGIVESNEIDSYEEARSVAEEQDTKPRRATQSNNQQLDLFELDSLE